MAKMNNTENPSINTIGKGTSINGDIHSDGDFRVDGVLKGSITSKGKIVVGTTGNIEGKISCQNADISGTVKATVTVSELLSLKSTSQVQGEIITNKLAIEPGAKFSGSCDMDGQNMKAVNASTVNETAKDKEKIA